MAPKLEIASVRLLAALLAISAACGTTGAPSRKSAAEPTPETPPAGAPVEAEPGSPPPAPDDMQKLAAEVAEMAPEGFVLLEAPPFVVTGDLEPRELRRFTERTIRWAVERLREGFFDKEPSSAISIWLFSGAESYSRHSRELFGRRPDTPFGYYSPPHRALVMNIATGGGTLVHEIVHPFVEADFPDCPPWLNEGLGSLFEQCAERDGRIHGLVNWRLPGLSRAIRSGDLPRFEELLALDERRFYDEDPGTNYAQSRYLCLYLQERGLLRRFYRELRDNVAGDPRSVATLRGLLGVDDLDAFQRDWEAWVLSLKYDPDR
ncbi:MAG: hypothetical protein R6V85_10360 [Polyangia bacterium]